MPDTLTLREITFAVDVPGFRSQSITVVTTLTDAKLFPTRAFPELFLRDIKISLGMDELRCKTPEMVHKELQLFLIAYNLIRAFMFQTAQTHAVPLDRISFKGTLSTLRTWAPHFLPHPTPASQSPDIFQLLLSYLAQDLLPQRPNRTEPRVKKRRPKNYPRLTSPRHEFKEIPHRNRYKKALS